MGAVAGRAWRGALVMWGLLLAGCSQHAATSSADARPEPDLPGRSFGLPALPLNDAMQGPRRQVLTVNSYDGADRLLDAGAGVTVNQNNGQWLELDAAAGSPYAWAVWRFAESGADPFEQFQVNCGTPAMHYYVAYGDYARGRWTFYRLAEQPAGHTGSFTIDPAALPGGEGVLHSPGGFAYLALIAAPDNTEKLQVKGIDATTPGGVLPGQDPIFDQFENNDTLASCTALLPGSYQASIHQSLAAEMQDPDEKRDYYDCYCVEVPAGKILTATLRHETFDHFGSGFENDCDLLFYLPGASDIGNDFDEGLSSSGIWYDPFEQVNFSPGGSGGMYQLVILGDVSEPGVRTNAEYNLAVFVSDAVYTVSGSLTQEGQALDKDVVAFLEPGNFNANTPVPGEGTPGEFTIQGVPPGSYTLKVHGSARFGQTGYVWPEGMPVTVINSNVSSFSLDIGPDPA